MSKKVKFIIVTLITGIAYGAYDFYIFQTEELPILQAKVVAKEQAVATAQTELSRLKTFAANIENVKQELNELNVQLEAALEHMPRAFNLSDLLRRLSLLAQNSGIEMYTFRPRKASDEKNTGSFYSTTTIEFDLKGTFTQTLLFLDQLSRLKRIVNVEHIRVRPNSANTLRSGGIVAETQARVRTYRFSE